jgi:hypothetical protein
MSRVDQVAAAGLLGAVVGAAVSGLSAWLTQRVQVRRDEAGRRFAERERWTVEKRAVFRDVHDAADAWAHALRRLAGGEDVPAHELEAVERRFHGLVYEVALVCGAEVSGATEALEDTFLVATNRLGRSTQYGEAAGDDVVRTARAEWQDGDLAALREQRVHLLQSMRRELGVD